MIPKEKINQPKNQTQKDKISITERAAKQIKKQLEKRGTPDAYVRILIRGGGCNGYSYIFEFADISNESDHIFEKDGAKIIIDPKSIIYLDGTEIDFETGIRGHGFKIKNPNEKSSCGCGESIMF